MVFVGPVLSPSNYNLLAPWPKSFQAHIELWPIHPNSGIRAATILTRRCADSVKPIATAGNWTCWSCAAA